MKAIILAAGKGQRLRPLTDLIPKCMVKYQDRPIIDHILDTMRPFDIGSKIIVTGYREEVLKTYLSGRDLRFLSNMDYESTNMVSTLFCAEQEMDDDIIISYSDIIYTREVLSALIDSKAAISCIVDTKWKELWLQRMEDPLSDAETMLIDTSDNTIIELGKKPKSYEDIQGQYIGLIKITRNALKKIIKFYHSLDKNRLYDGNSYQNMYMTSFLQLIIDHLIPVHAVRINGGWTEIDQLDDLNVKIVS